MWATPRRARPVAAMLGIAVALAVCTPTARGQADDEANDPPAIEARSPSASTAPLAGEVKPELFLLKGKDGELHPVPGMTLEQFQQLYKLKHHLAEWDHKPRVSMDRMTLTGSATGNRADITATFEITIHESGWQRVPLGMRAAILRPGAKYDGPGEHFLHFEPEGDAYILWVRGDQDTSHRVTLNLLVPVTTVGAETRLRLNLPRATVSQVKLEVPEAHASVRVAEPATLESTREIDGDRTALSVAGAGGDVQIAWRPAAQGASGQSSAAPAALEAHGELLIRIDGRSVSTEARLTVFSLGGAFDRIRVRLPPGAELRSARGPGDTPLTLKPMEMAGNLVDFKLEKKTTERVELHIVTERPHDIAKPEELIELAGFEVLGAVRQWGHIAVRVVGDWQLGWGERAHVRQVDTLPDTLRREDVAAGFEYNGQPCSLKTRLVPQKTRISVTPRYVVLVQADQLQLTAKLNYVVRGAKARSLVIELPGWEVDDVSPANIVGTDMAIASEGEAVTIPLLQPTSGEFELTVRAHRSVPANSERVTFDMPRPRADATSPAEVIVLASDNVELDPVVDEIVGLSMQPLRPQVQLPELQQDPLHYRGDANAARFVARLQVHARDVAAQANSRFEIDERQCAVRQRFAFQVLYQAVDKLLFVVPRGIASDKLTVTLEGQRLTPTVVRNDESEGFEVIRIALPKAHIGRCELDFAYAVPLEPLSPSTTAAIDVPLIMPHDARLTRNEVLASAKSGITVTARDGVWQVNPQGRQGTGASEGVALSCDQAASEVPLAIARREQRVSSSTVVDRCWVQTRLTETLRQDRAVYRLTTAEAELRLELPSGVAPSDLQVVLDGTPLAVELDRQRHVRIRTGASRRPIAHVLELRFRWMNRPGTGRLEFACPRFQRDVWVQQLYWELILPSDEHVALAPARFDGEFEWTWNGFGFERRPLRSSRDLAHWAGASAVERMASTGDVDTNARSAASAPVNRYLFSSVGAFDSLELTTARRSVLVFLSSLAVLALGLSFIYLPRVRHPAILFVLAIVVAAFSIWQPEVAFLIGQACGLGLILALMAAMLATWHQPLRPVAVAPVRPSSQVRTDRSTTERRRTPTSAQLSTTTAPATASTPQQDS